MTRLTNTRELVCKACLSSLELVLNSSLSLLKEAPPHCDEASLRFFEVRGAGVVMTRETLAQNGPTPKRRRKNSDGFDSPVSGAQEEPKPSIPLMDTGFVAAAASSIAEAASSIAAAASSADPDQICQTDHELTASVPQSDAPAAQQATLLLSAGDLPSATNGQTFDSRPSEPSMGSVPETALESIMIAPAIAPPLPIEEVAAALPGSNASAMAPKAREQLRSVLKALELDARTLTRLSSQLATPDEKLNIKPAYQFTRKIIAAMAKLVYPNEPTALTELFEGRNPAHKTVQDKLAENVIAAMKATRRGTIARRYVRSVLCGSMSRAEVNRLLGNSPDDADTEIATAPGDDGGAEEGDTDAEGDGSGKNDVLKMTGKTFSRARRDWDMLLARGELQPAKYGRSKVQDEALRNLLSFLFSPENIVLLSWCGMRLVVDGKRLEVPAVMVAKNGSAMHQDYCKAVDAQGGTPLSRGSFYAVLNALTRKEVKKIMPIDNATRTFVKDPLTLVRDLIIRLLPYTERSQFLREVDKAEWFLLHSFSQSHLGMNSEGFHDLNFALKSSSLLTDLRAMHSRTVRCQGCVFPFSVMGEIPKMAPLQHREAVYEVAMSCRDKFIYYLRYKCRKTAQARAVENALHEIVTKKMYGRVVVFMSYIDKSLATRAGKRTVVPNFEGVTQHGSMVFFLPKPMEGELAVDDLKYVFYHHFISSEVEGDHSVVLHVLEALLRRIRKDMPHVNEVMFVSDNLPSYKNEFLPYFLPQFTKHYRLRAARLIHSCSQICEFLIEAQFQVSTNMVLEEMGDTAAITPAHAADVINENSCLLNASAEIIALDSEAMEFSKKLKIARSHRSVLPMPCDANDIVYQDYQATDSNATGESELIKARVFEYGGIGKGEPMEVDPSFFKLLAQTSEDDSMDQENTIPTSSATPAIATDTPDASRNGGFAVFTVQNGVEVKKITPSTDEALLHRLGLSDDQAVSPGFVWLGPVTGARVLVEAKNFNMSQIKVLPRPNGVTGGYVVDTISRIHFASSRLGPLQDKQSKDDLVGIQAVKPAIAGRSCHECNRSFKSERFLNSHQCKGPPVDKDVSARAVALASEMFREGELPIFHNASEHLWAGSLFTENSETGTIAGLEYGWGCSPPPAPCVENSFVMEYKKEVFQWLDEIKGKEEAIVAANMHERLLSKYQAHGDVPSTEIVEGWCNLRKAAWRIQPFCQIGVDGTPVVTYEEETENGPGKSRMKTRYIAKITEMHTQQMVLAESERPKPRHMFKQFEEFFKDEQGRVPPDFPNPKQVMNKINALRSKSKQRTPEVR